MSFWLDNIIRGLLTYGTLRYYIQEFSVSFEVHLL